MKYGAHCLPMFIIQSSHIVLKTCLRSNSLELYFLDRNWMNLSKGDIINGWVDLHEARVFVDILFVDVSVASEQTDLSLFTFNCIFE